MIGPFRGGRAIAATGVPGDSNTFYFGAVGGGIWKTTNAGLTWSPIFDDQQVASIGAIEVAPSDPNVIYAGTGEADIRSDLSQGNGVYKSIDAGKTWRNIGLRDSRQIGRILIHPRNPDIVYVAALGHAYGPNAERGVYRSTDGGGSWQKVLDKGPDVGATDLAFDSKIHRLSTPACGRRAARLGAFMDRWKVPAAACTNPSMAAITGPNSQGVACPQGLGDAAG